MADVHYLTLSDVCRRIKSGELTSVHVTEMLLARIGELDGDLKSYVKVLSDAALGSAERHDQERDEGGDRPQAVDEVRIGEPELAHGSLRSQVPDKSDDATMKTIAPTTKAA